MLETITWTGSAVRLLDQTKLPTETCYVEITDERQMHDAIRRLVVRGAPAIGVAAAFGVYLGVREAPDGHFRERLAEVCDYLATARPTAVNLFWAIERVRKVTQSVPDPSLAKRRLLDECLAMLEEDARVCRRIGENGLAFLQSLPGRPLPGRPEPQIRLLTHCNAGSLATVRYGTALAPVYVGAERGVKFHVFADETRPLLQGSRITAYELSRSNIPVTLLCDNMAASVLRDGKVDAVIVGADRIAANGDTANKIGTLGVAILARHYGVPFVVAAPISTVDLSLPSGDRIPIEQRDRREVTHGLGSQTAPEGVEVYNPAFDVTPNDLITAIVTERGVATPPFEQALREWCVR